MRWRRRTAARRCGSTQLSWTRRARSPEPALGARATSTCASPWGEFSEGRYDRPPGQGGNQSVACDTLTNPSSYGDIAPARFAGDSQETIGDVWFDVKCNDGLGFQYYRVDFPQELHNPYDNAGILDVVPTWWNAGSANVVHNGPIDFEAGNMRVCGFDGAAYHCFTHQGGAFSGVIWPLAQNIIAQL
jgi:hypothetical protein